MKIHEVLKRDPRTAGLANDGQARITKSHDAQDMQVIRAELETFVCDGQYGEAVQTILRSYLDNLTNTKQKAAWVSGFFGSGKSHLLKMLGHLWVDTKFDDGSTARSLVPSLPQEVSDLLTELDTQIARSQLPAVTASGTLPAGTGDFAKMTILSIILQSQGLPEQYAQARFCFWLQDEGHYDTVRNAVEDAGRSWEKELNNLYVSGVIAKALLSCDPNFASDEKAARATIKETFPNKSDLTTKEFLEMARSALSVDGQIPLTMLVLDEVQQYIGDSRDRAAAITEITEAIYTQLDSRVMLVASGQSALTATPQLIWLKDRFTINVSLSDAEVEVVTRKVLLHKNAAGIPDIKSVLQSNAGEIDKHLDGSRLSSRPEDASTIVEDYPLLPTRRRFWERCFRAVDAQGTQSQLRSQLRILHDTLKDHAERTLGVVIPADVLFSAISSRLVETGVLLNELDLRIRKLDDGTPEGHLNQRICGLVFLISQLPREDGIDEGIRATPKIVADLLIDDITIDSGPFRKQVENALEAMSNDGTLMKVEEEYRLQTTEGAEWDKDFRTREASIRNNASEIEHKRSQMLGQKAQEAAGKIKLSHGESKEKRHVHLHTGSTEPQTTGDQIAVWMQDGWSIAQKEVENAARARGHHDAVVHLFFPRKSADELTALIAKAEAARQIIDTKGIPSTPEGQEARKSMQSRYASSLASLEMLINEIIVAAKVFQGGGNEVFGSDVEAKLLDACGASMARLFPQFNDGDHKGWGAALNRARKGSDEPLKLVDWNQATDDHPVVREVMVQIGTGAKGAAVRKTLQASPFGWPRDAIDAAIIALHRSGAIRASLNNQPLKPGELDQNKISTTDLHPESVRLSASQKMALRGLFQKANVSVKSGEEEIKARAFLDAVRQSAEEASGEAPRPALPDLSVVNDLASLHGTEQLSKILEQKDALEALIQDWTHVRTIIDKREPAWNTLKRLSQFISGLPVHETVISEMAAIESNRSLTDSTDLVTPLVSQAANALRAAVTEQDKAYADAFSHGQSALKADNAWQQLGEDDHRAILSQVGLQEPKSSPIGSDDELITSLTQSDLPARSSAVSAVGDRIARALAAAAQKLKPDAKRVGLRPATLNTEADVKAWIAEQESKLLTEVAKAPVIVG